MTGKKLMEFIFIHGCHDPPFTQKTMQKMTQKTHPPPNIIPKLFSTSSLQPHDPYEA